MDAKIIAETNAATQAHIDKVREYLERAITELKKRGEEHDASKMEEPELSYFCTYTPKLKNLKYGSADYQDCLLRLAPALDHHYEHNRHHPEHFDNGIDGMTLVDLLEMLCDWKAATLRTADGSMEKSLEHNRKRFKISDQLFNILRNTAEELFAGTDE